MGNTGPGILLAPFVLLLCLSKGHAASTKNPHILLLVIDDLGWADTTLQPDVVDPDIPTPNLKALMDSGVRLGNYYTQTVCSPTRSSLMTGRFPFRMGMQHQATMSCTQ